MGYIEDFERLGFAGPFPLMPATVARSFTAQEIKLPDILLPYVKARHLMSRAVATVALHPDIINKILPLIGDDFLLSGSQIIKQKPHVKHEWHVDIEHLKWNGLTVWIALSNVKAKECISVISGSHKLNTIPNDLKNVDLYSNDDVLPVAQRQDPGASWLTWKLPMASFLFSMAVPGTVRKISLIKYGTLCCCSIANPIRKYRCLTALNYHR